MVRKKKNKGRKGYGRNAKQQPTNKNTPGTCSTPPPTPTAPSAAPFVPVLLGNAATASSSTGALVAPTAITTANEDFEEKKPAATQNYSLTAREPQCERPHKKQVEAAAAAAEKPLPPGWSEEWDETQARNYYYNPVGPVSQWERPKNRSQRKREEREKQSEAKQEKKKAAEEQQAQQKADDSRIQLELTIRRAEERAQLQELFGTPAIDKVTTDMTRSSLSTTATLPSPPTEAAAVAAAGIATETVAASKSSVKSTTEKETTIVCYHGSSAEYFNAGSEYLELVKSYVVLQKKYFGSGHQQGTDAENNFFDDEKNRKIMLDDGDEFINFVFALGVSLYLKLTSKEKENYRTLQQATGNGVLREIQKTPSFELQFILRLGFSIKYQEIPEMNRDTARHYIRHRYAHDVESERGTIRCLYRETKKYCGCMVTDKNRAKNMEKEDLCFQCNTFFPAADMLMCERCKLTVYCSKECNDKAWPLHKPFCSDIVRDQQQENYSIDDDTDGDI